MSRILTRGQIRDFDHGADFDRAPACCWKTRGAMPSGGCAKFSRRQRERRPNDRGVAYFRFCRAAISSSMLTSSVG
jgi:hypothetical protein